MVKLKFIAILALKLTVIFNLQSAEPIIEKYQAERDQAAVAKILDDNPSKLRYESVNMPAGSTEKYLTDDKYITDVLRVGDKTVGFINYAAFDSSFLTFYLGRSGLVHLLGVEKEYQRKGYGTQLLRNAISEIEKRNVPEVMIAAKKNDKVAIALYEKEGFVCIVPEHVRQYLPNLYLTRKLNFSADKLPKGNLIQQYPKTALTLATATASGLLFLKFRHKLI